MDIRAIALRSRGGSGQQHVKLCGMLDSAVIHSSRAVFECQLLLKMDSRVKSQQQGRTAGAEVTTKRII